MRIKIILGILAVISGVVLFAFSEHIAREVATGRGEIRSGQEKVIAGQRKVDDAQTNVDTANELIDDSTRVKGLGGLLTSPAQEKIDSGQEKIDAGRKKIRKGTQEANYYEKLSGKFKIGAVVLILIGALLLLLSAKKGKGFKR